MTPTRELAAKLAAAVFDRIERDRTLILQTIEDELHSALLLHEAEQKEKRQEARKAAEGHWADCVKYLIPQPGRHLTVAVDPAADDEPAIIPKGETITEQRAKALEQQALKRYVAAKAKAWPA